MAPKKSTALTELINAGLVQDGELLRYKNKAGNLLLIGRAREGGIEVKGHHGLLNFTAFEAAAGSTYHRPAEHTHATSGQSLQALKLGAAAGSSSAAQPVSVRTAEPEGEPLLKEEHDEFCYVCGLGGDLMCCETCSTTMHAPCAGLASIPEGDWFCPWCHCCACGRPGWGEPSALLPTGLGWVECREGYCSMAALASSWHGSGGNSERYRPPFVGGPPEGEGGGQEWPAGVGVPEAEQQTAGVERAKSMDVDGIGEGVLHAAQNGAHAGAMLMTVAGATPAGPAGSSEGARAFAAPGAPSVSAEVSAASRAGRLDLSQLQAVLAAVAATSPPDSSSSYTAAAVDIQAAAAAEARCPVSGRRQHARCLAPSALGALQTADCSRGADGTAQRQQQQQQPWFSARPAQLLGWQLAQLCARGAIPLGALGDGTPLTFQLVQGAAVAQPQDCRGYAPRYNDTQREELRQALSAAAHILRSCYQSITDSRTGGDAMLWMLRGACLAGRQLDFSAMHTALLYAGSSLVAAACVRLLGPAIAEVPLLAVRPELQRNRLGSALLAAVEAVASALSLSAAAAAGTAAAGDAGAGSEEGPGGEGPLLLTPAFWGPGCAYMAYPPGQPGVPDVVPLWAPQARWGYALAPRLQLLQAWAHPLVRLPGLLLACKRLGTTGGQGEEPAPLVLPRRLVLNEDACNLAQMLRDGVAIVAPREALQPAADQAAQKAEPKMEPEGGVQQEQWLGAGADGEQLKQEQI